MIDLLNPTWEQLAQMEDAAEKLRTAIDQVESLRKTLKQVDGMIAYAKVVLGERPAQGQN